METMTDLPTIGIVTVLYNSGAVLEEFFLSLDKQTYKNFVLYVIDNKSPDDSLGVAERMSSQVSFPVVLIPEAENWGVAKGNNIGIRRALADRCDYVLLSNNDTVLESTTIERLLEGLKEQGASMTVPKIYFHGTDQIWAAGGRFDRHNMTTPHIGNLQKDKGQFEKAVMIEYAPTCFMLIEKGVFDRIGFMDEKYFVYYDDTDFVWRAIIKGDERMVYIPDSILWHKESACTGGRESNFKLYYVNRNVIYFTRKNLPFFHRLTIYAFYLTHYFFCKLWRLDSEQRALVRKAYREGFKM